LALIGRAVIAVVCAGRSGGLLGVDGAGGRDAATIVGHVAFAGGRTADRAARLELIGWTRRARAGAAFGDIAWTGRCAANGAGGLELIGGAIVVRAVAALRHVAHSCRRTA